jgi:hypothetical protein
VTAGLAMHTCGTHDRHRPVQTDRVTSVLGGIHVATVGQRNYDDPGGAGRCWLPSSSGHKVLQIGTDLGVRRESGYPEWPSFARACPHCRRPMERGIRIVLGSDASGVLFVRAAQ